MMWPNKKTDHYKDGYCENMRTVGSCYGCIHLVVDGPLVAKCLRDGKTKEQKDKEGEEKKGRAQDVGDVTSRPAFVYPAHRNKKWIIILITLR